MPRKTVEYIKNKKKASEVVVMLTAYDYSMASIIDKAGVDIILVGDSLANVFSGLKSTTEVTMEQMIYHCKAVNRAVEQALLVGDMPYEAYQTNSENALENAQRFVNEAGCGAIKLEWFDNCLEVSKKIVHNGIDVMGHVGLTPQTAQEFKVQGKKAQSAQKIIDQAVALEDAGCFSVVLECIPVEIADMITKKLRIPTIGIGAGNKCDGQVLVTYDILGLFDRFRPKFVKQYANLQEEITRSVGRFSQEVKSRTFPSESQSFVIDDKELKELSSNQ